MTNLLLTVSDAKLNQQIHFVSPYMTYEINNSWEKRQNGETSKKNGAVTSDTPEQSTYVLKSCNETDTIGSNATIILAVFVIQYFLVFAYTFETKIIIIIINIQLRKRV